MEAPPALTLKLPDAARRLTVHTQPGRLLGWTWTQRIGLFRTEKWFAVLPDQYSYTGPLPAYLDAVNVLNGAAGLPAELNTSDW